MPGERLISNVQAAQFDKEISTNTNEKMESGMGLRTVSVCVLLVSSILSGGVFAKEIIDFQVMVVPDGRDAMGGNNKVDVYEPGSRASNCMTKSHAGCYDVPTGEEAEIRVSLTNGNYDCTHEGSWRLKDIVLGGEGDVNNPPDKPGPDGWGNLSDQAAKDFDADPITGVANVETQGNMMVVQNLNTAPYSIWYKVRVESCATNGRGARNVIEFDPRVDNRGRPSG